MRCPECKIGAGHLTNKPTRWDEFSEHSAFHGAKGGDPATIALMLGWQFISYGVKRLLAETYECPKCGHIWRKWF